LILSKYLYVMFEPRNPSARLRRPRCAPDFLEFFQLSKTA
jgi:hypothetical protein